MKNNKLLKYLAIGVVVLIIIMVIAKQQGCVGGEKATKVVVEKAEKHTIIEVVTANGKIEPEIEVKLSPDVSGEVVELYVKEGEEVEKGKLLAKINPDIYESALDRMEASLNTSKANLANAKARLAQTKAKFINDEANYLRNEKLFSQGVISQAEFDGIKANFEISKSDVEAAEQSVYAAQFTVHSAEAALKESKESLHKTSIYAPMSGTISKLSVEKGERVVGTSQFAGTEIMRIANLNEMEVNVSVNENDIIRVTKGDTAIIEVDAYQDRKFKGIVTEIANSANTTGLSADQITNFDVKIKILRSSYEDLISESENASFPFRPGMSATVDIQTQLEKDIIAVPIQAVTIREDSLKNSKDTVKNKKEIKENPDEYIFVYDNGFAKMIKVKTGIQDNKFIQIIEGINDGTEVITAPYRVVSKKLKDGSPVIKTDRDNLYEKED